MVTFSSVTLTVLLHLFQQLTGPALGPNANLASLALGLRSDGVITNVTASFQVRLPPNSPVQNITFGFGGPGVIGYIDLNGQFGSGSFLTGNVRVHLGTIVSIRRVESSDALGGQPGIEIELFSDDQFPVRNEILVLQIGARQFFLSGYPNGDLNTVVFTLTEEEFAAVSCGEPVIVQYGIAP